MKNPFIFALFALLPAFALDPSPTPSAPQDPNAVIERAEPFEVSYYTAVHTNAQELFRLASAVYARTIIGPQPQDRSRASGSWGFSESPNLVLIDKQRVLIHDTPTRTQAILDLFAELDQPAEEQAPVEAREVVTREYQPRYASLDDLEQVLRPFERSLSRFSNNVTSLPQSNRLVLSDYADQVGQMLELLQRIDVPTPQIELTCYILRGSSTSLDEPSKLPKELTENLERLVPFEDFEMLTMGVLRLSAATQTRGELEMQTAEAFGKPSSGTFDIQLEVGAFDNSLSVLTLKLFSAREHTTLTPPKGEKGSSTTQSRQLFETRTAVTAGEYAVMGATGAEPIFVVLRFTKVAQ